jgi:exopolysaccharide production protein ExoZ
LTFTINLFGLNGLQRSGGVDYFFVLTGFLISFIYGERIGTRQKVGRYVTNRFIRIYPFYWLITLIILPVYFLVPSFGNGFETHKDALIKSLVLIPQEHGPILPVAWSLSYFFLFYGMFLLLMALERKAAYGVILCGDFLLCVMF